VDKEEVIIFWKSSISIWIQIQEFVEEFFSIVRWASFHKLAHIFEKLIRFL